MKALQQITFILVILTMSHQLLASKLVQVSVIDKDIIMLYFLDGSVEFVDDGVGVGAYDHHSGAEDNELILYGDPLNVTDVNNTLNFSIRSDDDLNYNTEQNPDNIFRKSKLAAMSQETWNTGTNDFNYDWAYEHSIYLQLPFSMVQGKTYTITLNSSAIHADIAEYSLTYDIYNVKSEAIKVNRVGFNDSESIKAADLYMWMGDGGSRDYSQFEGNTVYIYNVNDQTSTAVGTVGFWQAQSGETTHSHKMLQSDVWKADFTGYTTPGTYRIAIEGIGCSDDFVIANDVYHAPFAVSVLGFFYMRIGQDNLNMTPVPRRPLFIPNVQPTDCKVYLTTMHPYHTAWGSFTSGDQWDQEQDWVQYKKSGNPTNPNAFGGHSDALDWDRHLGHVSIIYDMLLPYFISGGKISDDNLGIAESGNGIPDIIDEARNEVDFWLRLRDGKGYSHGLTNPDGANALYQAAPTAVAAWANAANAAMLANCFDIAGNATLMAQYKDSAINAYNYASGLSDQMLTKTQSIGSSTMSGRDFRMTAAAFLYNITGNTIYEDDINTQTRVSGTTSVINNAGSGNSYDQTYATAAYLFTPQTVHYQTLYNNMKASIIYQAKQKEANYTLSRPSRRASDNNIG